MSNRPKKFGHHLWMVPYENKSKLSFSKPRKILTCYFCYRIETVHNRGLVYRDIKPENFLLGRKNSKESNIIHLVDFGLATHYRDQNTGKMKKSPLRLNYLSYHSELMQFLVVNFFQKIKS